MTALPRDRLRSRTRRARRPSTVVDYAYEAVKRDILSGKLAPGSRIDQDALAEALGCSKIPLRSALERLAAEGLVQNHSFRGTTVSPLSLSELDEIYLVRCLLEKLATELAAARLTPDDLEALYGLVEWQEAVADDLDALLEANRAFHMKLYSLADRPLLLQIIERLWDLSERYRRAFLQGAGISQSSTLEHRHLVDLLAQGKGREAAEYVVQHNQKTRSVLIARMSQDVAARGDGDGDPSA